MIQLSDDKLHDAVSSVLTGLVGGALDDLQDRGNESALCSTVSLGGAFRGLVVVRCTEQTARNFAAGMFEDDPDALAYTDVADAVGEVANQVGGVVKTLVPGPTSLGLPVVVAGTGPGHVELPFLSSVALDRDEGRVDVFVFGSPTA